MADNVSTLRFTCVELDNWRNFKEVRLDLARRVFVVGPNATGKSNLLDVFRFLHDLVLDGGGLAKAIEVRGSLKKVRSLFARSNSDVRVQVTAKNGNEEGWRYELALKHRGTRDYAPLVTREVVERLPGTGRQAEIVLNRPDTDDKHDPQRLTQTAIQQVTANQQFRELADFFSTVVYLHAVPHLIREGLSAPKSAIGPDPYGRDLLQRIRETPAKSRDARLKRIGKILSEVTPQLRELSQIEDAQGRPHLQANFQHWRPQGAYQDESQFSDGTLRLIGLLWALQEKAGPLLLEEPELSLHEAIVRRLAPFIYRAQKAQGRQVLLSTHSVDLLADQGIAPEEVVLVQPSDDGSKAVLGASIPEVRQLMRAGIPASEAILPRTRTKQLPLFDTMSP